MRRGLAAVISVVIIALGGTIAAATAPIGPVPTPDYSNGEAE